MHSEEINIFVFVPKIPLEGTPNGVCTYAKELMGIFENSEKIKIHVVGKNGDVEAVAGANFHLLYENPPSFAARAIRKIFGRRGFDRFVAWKFVKKVKKKFKGKRIIFEMEEAFGYSLYFSYFTRVPIVVRLHGPWFLNGSALGVKQDEEYYRRIEDEGRAIYQTSLVTAPSQFVLDQVERYYNRKIKNSVVLFNPFPKIDTSDYWKPSPLNKNVLFVGRFDLHKGADVYIHAIFKTVARGANISGVFIGPVRGPMPDFHGVEKSIDDYIAWCEDIYEISSPIRFLGYKNPIEIKDFRKNSAVCIIASRVEILPYAVVESLSQGVPTIASRVGGIAELIEDGVNGLLFESENSEELMHKINKLLNDPLFSEEISKNALKMVEQYDKKHMEKTYASLYEDLLFSTVH